jgi:SAM-dependent methyltransferase
MTNPTRYSVGQVNVSYGVRQSGAPQPADAPPSHRPHDGTEPLITHEDFVEVIKHFQQSPQELFLSVFARYRVARRRFLEAKARQSMKFADQMTNLADRTLEHNLQALEDFAASARTDRLIRPLSAIDRIFFHSKAMKVLSVGPRSEMELMSLLAQGFARENIRGLDLFSYSPWIDAGDMHKMPYDDNSFDLLIAGWVLVYSSDPHQACREFLRVVRDRGFIAIGCTRLPAHRRAESGYQPKVDDLLEVFGPAVRRVYVRHDSESEDEEGRTIVIFDVRK